MVFWQASSQQFINASTATPLNTPTLNSTDSILEAFASVAATHACSTMLKAIPSSCIIHQGWFAEDEEIFLVETAIQKSGSVVSVETSIPHSFRGVLLPVYEYWLYSIAETGWLGSSNRPCCGFFSRGRCDFRTEGGRYVSFAAR